VLLSLKNNKGHFEKFMSFKGHIQNKEAALALDFLLVPEL
jgi:hypothetical protein